ncbi:SMC-Scp complex subunit ScpB [Amycolatopsis minnesotensis]|uniref:SMC-Scp complex subunit ScpB n=1 Tax=Amycolatopsis minnesotensis TaxID=337894 RepID=A0ABP5BGQ1_9PSEU
MSTDDEAAPVVDLDALQTARPDAAEPEDTALDDAALDDAEPDHTAPDDAPPADAPLDTVDSADAVVEPGTGPGEDVEDDENPELVAVASSLPDLTESWMLESALEALLLVVDSPASEESLADAVDQPVPRVTEALRLMATRFTERDSGIDLRRVGEGWRFFTRDTFAPFVEKLLLDGQRSKLTRAALETLAVIAYRQPVTRARVAAVRGVNVDGVIRTLLARGLIEETGTDAETGGTLYVTTELFLERLGLSSLNDLPPIAPLLPEVDSIDDI